MCSDGNTWCKSVRNELGRLTKVISNQLRATNTIVFIRKVELKRGRTVMYENVVCDYRPLKLEPFRVRLSGGGEILEYPDDASSPAASLLE